MRTGFGEMDVGGGSLEQVFRQYKVPGKRMEEMAILNNIIFKNKIPAGKHLKSIQTMQAGMRSEGFDYVNEKRGFLINLFFHLQAF
jgi:hypothetical protein